jgi:hypothetical protein
MPVDVTLARNFTFELNTGTIAVPNFVAVEGIDNLTHTPATVRSEARTFDDVGRSRHIVASRGDTFAFTGKYKVDEATGARAPGQEAVEAWANEFGPLPNGIKQCRITDTSGLNVITFNGSAEVTRFGGGNDDAATWGFTVEVDGPIT